MTVNYEKIMGRSFNELPEPEPLPDGKYLLKGRFASAFEWTSKEGDEGARISVTYEAVKAADADTAASINGMDVKGKPVESTFYVTNEEEERKVWDALAKIGIAGEDYDNLGDALKAVRGLTVIGTVRTRHFETKDGAPAFRNFAVKTEPVAL